MPPDQDAGTLVSFIGVQLQLAGSLLCLVLGLALRRGLGSRPWVSWWVASYAAVSVAVAAVVVRYYLLPFLPPASRELHETAYVAALYALYAGAKLVFLCCLLAGTWLFVTRTPPSRIGLGAGLALVLGVGVLFVLAPTELNPLMAWQAGFAVPTFLFCAWLLVGLPFERRTRGSRLLAVACVLLAILWILYVPGFLGLGTGKGTFINSALTWLTAHNSYVDVLFEFLLGFAMILAVLDDVFREAEDARAARLRDVAASEARLSQIIRAASEGIVLLDAGRRVVHCNPAATEILRCSESEMLGQTFDRFAGGVRTDDLWSRAAGRAGGFPATPPAGYEIRGLRADGEEFPMELSLRAIGDSVPEGYVLIVRDRTQRVRLETERARMQQQLAQAARLETIGRMVSGVAHELNNPLTAILAFGQDLLSQARNPADNEALTTIVQQSQRCRSIVQDLLTFARSKREDREIVAPRDVVDRVVPAFERQAATQGIRLEVSVGENLPSLDANPSALEQVLTNLLDNAFHAVGSGGAVAIRGSVGGDRVSLVVEDDGPGIPPEVLPRLFEPFFTTKELGKGTGLGLSVSHGIVEQHGGTLRAENRTDLGGRGARFVVALPFLDRRAISRDPHPALPPADLSARPAAPPPLAATGPRRVLVVDDEAPIRVAIRRYLERRGWTVEEAKDGREALEKLGIDRDDARSRLDQFDVIITDLKMPVVSGIDIHDRLAAVAPASMEKLVIISGDTASADVSEFVARLKRPLVQKPFDMRTLAEVLDQTAPPSAAPAAP